MFITAVGLIAVPAIKIYDSYLYANRLQTTAAHLQQAKTALNNFLLKNWRLPCPSSVNVGIETAGFGQNTACTPGLAGTTTKTGVWAGATPVRLGALPVRELGLPDDTAVDGWGNRILYAVTNNYTVKPAPQGMVNGSIRVIDSGNGGTPHDVTAPPGSAVYAVIAPGPDIRGTYSKDGSLLAACDTTVMAGQNCNLSATFDATFVESLNRSYDLTGDPFTSTLAFQAGAGNDPIPAHPAPITVDVNAFNLNDFIATPADWTDSGIFVDPGKKINITVTDMPPGAPDPCISDPACSSAPWTAADLTNYQAKITAGAMGWNNAPNCSYNGGAGPGFYGADGRPCNPVVPLGGVLFNPLGLSPDGTLIAKIGINGAPFVVGANPLPITATDEGEVYYIMNEYQFTNNWGHQQVTTSSN